MTIFARPLRLYGAFFIAASIIRTPARWENDSLRLAEATLELKRWLTDARHGPLGDIEAFAPFQYLIALPTFLIPRCPVSAMDLWSFCSRLSVAGLAWIFWREGRRTGASAGATVMMLVLLVGPLMAYATSTFNELPAAFLTTAFLAAALRGAMWPTAAGFVAAGLTKETAVPLLLPFWVYAIWRRRSVGRDAIGVEIMVLLAVTGLTIAMLGGFNWLRFHSLLNTHYLEPQLRVPKLAWRVEYAAALWISPNGGVTAFWPSWVGVIVATLWLARLRGWAVPLVMVVVLGGLTWGLADWHTPFGWWCWGPRLMLPWLPPILYLVLAAYPAACERIAYILVDSTRRCGVVASAAVLLALPHVLMLNDYDAVQRFFRHEAYVAGGHALDEPDVQHAMVSYDAWRSWPPMLWMPMSELWNASSFITVGLFSAGIVCLTMHLRSQIRRGSTLDS